MRHPLRQPLQRELLQEVVASDSLFCLIIFVPHECDDALMSWICEQCAMLNKRGRCWALVDTSKRQCCDRLLHKLSKHKYPCSQINCCACAFEVAYCRPFAVLSNIDSLSMLERGCVTLVQQTDRNSVALPGSFCKHWSFLLDDLATTC